jgi:hypothetical protein
VYELRETLEAVKTFLLIYIQQQRPEGKGFKTKLVGAGEDCMAGT